MYSNYFGFTTQPFTGLENQVLLSNPTYQMAYSCLRRGVAERRGLLLLIGVAGTGKTTLLRRLMADLKDGNQFILLCNAHLGFDDLLNYLCDNLDLRVESSGEIEKIHALEAYLIARLAEDHRVILILDDAQNLPDETLEGLHHLARLETVGRRLLQIVLSALPLLENRLAKTPILEPLHRDVAGRCCLEALDDDAVIHYINEHLRAAGYIGSSEDLFEEDALEKIITYSQGVPRLINLICNQALLLAYLNSEKCVSAKMVRGVGTDNLAHQQPHLNGPLWDSRSTQSVVSPIHPPPNHARPAPVVPAPPQEVHQAHHESDFSIESTESIAIPCSSSTHQRRSPPTHQRRRPRTVLAMIFLAVIAGTIVTIHSFDMPLDLNRLSWALEKFSWPLGSQVGSLDEPNTSRTVEMPTPPLDTPQEPIAISNETLSVSTSPLREPIPPAPDPVKTRRIETLLAEAEHHKALFRYTIPDGDNAIEAYREVLRLDSDNAEALQGIEDIKSDYLRWANAAYARGERTKAQKHLERALVVAPNDESVRRLLEELRQERR